MLSTKSLSALFTRLCNKNEGTVTKINSTSLKATAGLLVTSEIADLCKVMPSLFTIDNSFENKDGLEVK